VADCIAVGPDHAVYVFWWNHAKSQQIIDAPIGRPGSDLRGPRRGCHRPPDNGLAGNLGLTDSSGRALNTFVLPQAAVNPVTGDIYVIYPDKPKGPADKADIFFTQSTDGGSTWSSPLRVNDDGRPTTSGSRPWP